MKTNSSRNLANERMKYSYFELLRHAHGKSEKSISVEERALRMFETFTACNCFKRFDRNQAISFKAHLFETGLALPTIAKYLSICQGFFSWLRLMPGYKKAIKLDDIQYFSLSEKDKRAANTPSDRPYPSLKDVVRAVAALPAITAIEKRDRALIAFTALTGVRVSVLISLKLKHFDIARELVIQNPRECPCSGYLRQLVA